MTTTIKLRIERVIWYQRKKKKWSSTTKKIIIIKKRQSDDDKIKKGEKRMKIKIKKDWYQINNNKIEREKVRKGHHKKKLKYFSLLL